MSDNNVTSNNVWVSVKSCARCGRDHDDLVFSKFDNPIDEWTHYASCPYNGQPILMKVVYELVSEHDKKQ